MDFILEMYSLDHPNELKFTRPGKEDPGLQDSTAKAKWSDVLMGKAYEDYIQNKLPGAATLEILRKRLESPGGVVRMGGKN